MTREEREGYEAWFEWRGRVSEPPVGFPGEEWARLAPDERKRWIDLAAREARRRGRGAFRVALGDDWKWIDVTAIMAGAVRLARPDDAGARWRIEHTTGLWFEIDDRQIPLIDQRAVVEAMGVYLAERTTGFVPVDWGC